MKKINLGSIFESLIQGKKAEADNLFHKYTIAEGAKINSLILSEDETSSDELKNETSITIDLTESEANPDELNELFNEIMDDLGIDADVVYDEDDKKYTLTFDSEEESDTFTEELTDRVNARDIDEIEVCDEDESEEELDESSYDDWLEEPYYRQGDQSVKIESALDSAVDNFDVGDFLTEYSTDLGLDNIAPDAEPDDITVSKQEIMDSLNHYIGTQVMNDIDVELDSADTQSASDVVYPQVVDAIKKEGGIVKDDVTEDEIGDNQSPIDIARRMGYDAAKNGETRTFNSNLRSLMNDHKGDAQREDIHKAFVSGMDDFKAGKHVDEDKNFSKIAKSAGKEYGSKEAGERVAGSVLKNLRKEHPRKYSEKNLKEDEITSKNAWQYMDRIEKRIAKLEGIGLDNMTRDEEKEYDKLSNIYSDFKNKRNVTEDEIGDNQSPIDAARRMGYDAAKDGNENKFNGELRALMNDKAGDAQRADIHKAYIEGMDEYHNEAKVTEGSKLKSFKFNKVQHGSWGSTTLGTITVKAETEEEAISKADDKTRHLKNGDKISYYIDSDESKVTEGVFDPEYIGTCIIKLDDNIDDTVAERIFNKICDFMYAPEWAGKWDSEIHFKVPSDADYNYDLRAIKKLPGVKSVEFIEDESTFEESEDEDLTVDTDTDIDTVEDESDDNKLDLILAKISELENQIANCSDDEDDTLEVDSEEEEELPEDGDEYGDLSEDYKLEPVKTESNVDGDLVGADRKKNKQQDESPMSKVEGIDLAIKRDGIQSPSKDNARGYEWKNTPKVDKSKLKGEVKNAEQKLEKVNKDDKKALINKSQGKENDESVLGNGTVNESRKRVLRTRK